MENHKSFIAEADNFNKKNMEDYIEGIRRLFDEKVISSDSFLVGREMENDYDVFLVYQSILTKDAFLKIKYILGGHKEYLKLNCDVFSDSDKKINLLESQINELCGVENGYKERN